MRRRRRGARAPARVRAVATLKLQVDGKHLAGPTGIALLRAIGSTGSLAAAAHDVGLSYKGAWSYVEEMGRLLGAEVVRSRRGGARGGGGSRLTAKGREILALYLTVERRVAAAVKRSRGRSRD